MCISSFSGSMAEHLSSEQKVVGSSPIWSTTFLVFDTIFIRFGQRGTTTRHSIESSIYLVLRELQWTTLFFITPGDGFGATITIQILIA